MVRRHLTSRALLLITIVIAGLLVRVWNLWEYQLNPDEMQFFIIAKGQTLGEVWRRSLMEVHPPLAWTIYHYLMAISDHLFFLRIASVTASMFAIIGMYRFGQQLRGAPLGLFCALCMALLPMSVSVAMTIRNYAFFMAFACWALYFFARYRQTHRTRDLLTFSLLLCLASATHFSGFMLGAICGLSEGLTLLYKKHWRFLGALCAAYIPLFALAALLYAYYFAPGATFDTWNRFFLETNHSQPSNIGLVQGIVSCFIPFLHWLRHNDMHEGLLPNAAIGLAFLGMIAYGIGFYRMYKVDRPTFFWVFIAWLVAMAIGLSGYYPLAETRHTSYFLPFFILPLWYALEGIAQRPLPQSSLYGMCLLTLLTAAALKTSHLYEWYGDELSLKQDDFDDAQAYLHRYLQPQDRIVTNGLSGYTYLLYAKDKGTTPYDHYGALDYHQALIVAPFGPPIRPYHDAEPFRTLLLSYSTPGAHSFWFIIYGTASAEIIGLMQCPALRGHITHFFSRNDVLLFSVSTPTLEEFLHDDAKWQQCYAGFTPLITARMFNAFAQP